MVTDNWAVIVYALVGVVLYLVRMFVVSRLSGLLLKGYRHLKTTVQDKDNQLDSDQTAQSESDKNNPPIAK